MTNLTSTDLILEEKPQEINQPTHGWLLILRRLLGNRLARIGLLILILLLVMAVAGPYLAPYDPNALDMANRLSTPDSNHLLGTDEFGRDVLSRIIYGAQVSLKVGLIAVGISMVAGTLLGVLSGYYGGLIDEIIMRLMDILFAFPAILLAIAILAILGEGVENAMIAIGVVYTPIFARITRGSALTVRQTTYVEASRALGASDGWIIFSHLLPNVSAPIIVEASLSLAFAILNEAALSFLGLGTQIPDPSWGRMLKESRGFIQSAPWLGIFPGLAIMLTVMGFNFVGDGLRNALDPHFQQIFSKTRSS
ncbi:MAG: ABC transporter permease [Anaerolineales bacterium]|nr:ABC transporter permease [Anaerolineales bacterium]